MKTKDKKQVNLIQHESNERVDSSDRKWKCRLDQRHRQIHKKHNFFFPFITNEKCFPSSNISFSQTFQWPWMIRRSMANQQTNLVLASSVIDFSPPAGLSQLAGCDTSYGCWNLTPPPPISTSVRPQTPTGRYPAGLARPAQLGQRKCTQALAFLY